MVYDSKVCILNDPTKRSNKFTDLTSVQASGDPRNVKSSVEETLLEQIPYCMATLCMKYTYKFRKKSVQNRFK